MKKLMVLAMFALACSAATAHETQHTYFMGESKFSAPDGTPMFTGLIIVEKTMSPGEQLIVERAIEVQNGKPTYEYTMNMKVSGSSFTLADSAHTVTGKGELHGTPWHWTYFKGTFKTSTGIKIDDENFMSDPAVVVARKKISKEDGTLLMVEDACLHSISEESFKLLEKGLKPVEHR
jgi:hypothetical protein